jgi:hypothetical protein
MPVQAGGMAGWTLTGDRTAVITAAPPADSAPGAALTAALTAANPEAPDKTLTVPVTIMPVGGSFTRPAADTVYTVEYYDQYGAAALRSANGLVWQYVPETENSLRKILAAVYLPNAPGTADNVEQGFAAVPYNEAISRTVLGLFTVTVGAAPAGDRIRISGSQLPAGTDRFHPVVIDAGIPGADNNGLPAFVVPDRGLGDHNGDYGHIRLRVNRGARLVIEAGNSGYTAANGPCPTGWVKNGTVEVMGGGFLRSGAYKGSPLGENAVTLVRLGAFFAAGPETSVDQFYSGWLIGPPGADARIQWDSGDQNGDYLEIRPGKIAFSANITVRKTLILDSSLWFINGPTVTVDAAGDVLTVDGKKGLFAAAGADCRFYGTASMSGGQNPANVMAKIILKPGSSLHRSFLTGTPGNDEFVTASGGDTAVSNQGAGAAQAEYYADNSRSGYLNWLIP